MEDKLPHINNGLANHGGAKRFWHTHNCSSSNASHCRYSPMSTKVEQIHIMRATVTHNALNRVQQLYRNSLMTTRKFSLQSGLHKKRQNHY